MKRIFPLIVYFVDLLQPSEAHDFQCFNAQPTASAPHKNVWSALTAEEYTGVSDVLIHKFNLTANPVLNGRENIIVQIDLLQPNKSDVLPFINGEASEPKRYARASVQYGVPEAPYLQEYIVGPLPATNATLVQPLTYPFNNGKEGRSRLLSIYAAGNGINNFIERLGSDIEDITRELWNATLADQSVFLRTGTVALDESDKQIAWATFLSPPVSGFDSVSLLPLGVFLQLDLTSRDWKEWRVTAWYYHGKLYNSTDAFRSLVFSPGFEKPPPNIDGPWTSTDKQGDPLPLDELPPPTLVSQGSQRFSVDEKENFVSWMDFSFYFSTSADNGVSLFDIQFKGKRIIYELQLQEALAHYAGADPVMSETLYFDSEAGMGVALAPLVKGYDCPSYATYLNATWSKNAGATNVPNAICLFESDPGYPLRRHHAAGYTSTAKNVLFTMRSISTVSNYDYLIDYRFFLDGSMEVSFRASGYISSAYFAGNEEYGFQIHDFLSGSMHDHALTFKADLDILGEKNSLQRVEFKADTVEYPWAVGQPRNTMKAVKNFIKNESESSIDWAPNDAVLYAVVNKDSPNRFGEFPGYRVKRSSGTCHLTTKASSLAGNAAHFATKDLFVTRQKDTEPWGADRNNAYDVNNPLVDFSKFLDGESIEQEDLVLYFNLGTHHLPHTGDLPNTMMTSAHSSIRLEPLNYLEGDPSIQTSQQVHINSETGNVETFGARRANCSINLSTIGKL